MFVLGRRVGERIIITVPPSAAPREIAVSLVRARIGDGDSRIGFEADGNGEQIRIDREEVHLARKAAAARDAKNAHIARKAGEQ